MVRTFLLAASRLGVIAGILAMASCASRPQQDAQASVNSRYSSSVSLAVQKEWERNCRLHRDRIEPGSLFASFEVAPDGKVRSVSFSKTSGATKLQKRLVSQSIHSAAIPPFPDELKEQFKKEPLQIIYRFTY